MHRYVVQVQLVDYSYLGIAGYCNDSDSLRIVML